MLKAYMKRHTKGLIAAAAFAVLLTGSFYLYRLPVRAAAYPVFLCALLGAALLALDFHKTVKTHRRLEELKKLSADMLQELPETDSIAEKDYQDIIRKIRGEMLRAQDISAARERDVTDYYTTWAHQIKTPIAAMNLKLQEEDTPLSRRLSADLLRIEQYVDMVMAFIRLDADSGDYVFRECELDAVIRQAVSKFAAEFIDRKLKLVCEPSGRTAVTDAKWLGFVIEQLLSNALKYTPSGSISVFVKDPLTICVEDTGIGISPQDVPRVFEKGYTGYNGRKYGSASGLGLYLCKRICDNLHARISIAAGKEGGTLVCVELAQYEQKAE